MNEARSHRTDRDFLTRELLEDLLSERKGQVQHEHLLVELVQRVWQIGSDIFVDVAQLAF